MTASTLEITGGSGATDHASAEVQATLAGAITLDDNASGARASLIFGGTTAQSFSGTVDGKSANEGDISISSGAFRTFTDKIGNNNRLRSVDIAAGGQAVFNETVSTQAMSIGGTVTFNKAVTLTGGALTINNGSKMIIGNSFSDGDTVITTDTASSVNVTSSKVSIALPTSFTTGSITIIDGSAGSAINASDFVIDAPAGHQYVLRHDANNQDLIASVFVPAPTTVHTRVLNIFGAAFDAALAAGNAEIASVFRSILEGRAEPAEVELLAEQLSENILDATDGTLVTTGAQIVEALFTRLASFRKGPQFASSSASITGFSAGDDSEEGQIDYEKSRGLWLKTFGNKVTQGKRFSPDGAEVTGYDAESYGITVGHDQKVFENSRLGGSISYIVSEIKSRGAGNSQANIESYQASLYGDYTTEQFYLEGSLGFGVNQVKEGHDITINGVTSRIKGDYRSRQYMASIAGGVPFQVLEDYYITPTASLDYTYLTFDPYTETSATSLNRAIDVASRNTLIAGIGGEFSTHLAYDGGVLIPLVKLGVSYDLFGEDVVATARYTGGGTAFRMEGAKVERLGGNAGLGLSYESDQWTFSFNYDVEFKKDKYMAQSVLLDIRYEF